MARKQFRKQPHHDFAVLQHIGDAGRRTRIVFKDIKRFGIDAHDVDAGDVHVNIVRNLLSAHLGTESRVAEHEIVRHHAGTQDVARAVDIPDEGVECVDALDEAFFHEAPFGAGHDSWNDIERNQAFLRIRLAVNGKRDADAPEDQFGFTPPVIENVGRHFLKPTRQLAIGRPHAAIVARHFIEGCNHPRPPPHTGYAKLVLAFRPELSTDRRSKLQATQNRSENRGLGGGMKSDAAAAQ